MNKSHCHGLAAVAPRLAQVRDAREHLAMLAKARRIAGPQSRKARHGRSRAGRRAGACCYLLIR
jgi:hypothetical protein